MALRLIRVRYAGPTNTRGSRYVASCPETRARHTEPYDHSRSREDNVEAAAEALMSRLMSPGGSGFRLVGMAPLGHGEEGVVFEIHARDSHPRPLA